jgi:ABC-type nitrate/sulfonate/bicarbonate transport system ATPase subunit
VLQLTARIVAESKLTTMMVTHSMRQALDVGERTVMLHQGNVVLDVSGEERADGRARPAAHVREGARRKAGGRRPAAGLIRPLRPIPSSLRAAFSCR